MKKPHLKDHADFAEMVGAHTRVWARVLDRAMTHAVDADASDHYAAELAAVERIRRACTMQKHQPGSVTPKDTLDLIGDLQAHAGVWRELLGRAARHADEDDRRYYEHELQALQDILDASEIERNLLCPARDTEMTP